ncbi:MAG: DUF3805 domain-containing protein [Bacteroidaceae bacterium]|nr:DUF3805 domain-containing protein [Bacteroidaceae bacterium]
MVNGKKFIAPGAWFSMMYPADWHESEGEEESFLFYNPDDWDGNFRISAFRGEDADYGQKTVADELKRSRRAQAVMVGDLKCAYSCEAFTEDGQAYENHQWVTGIGDVAFEISFATAQGASIRKAQEVIASLQLRYPGVKYHAETIPVRLMEIYQIDEAYDWVQSEIKKQLKRDFRGEENDIRNMQRIIDNGSLNPRKRDAWIAMGITLCVILTNDVDGMEWRTLIDGSREVPVLENTADGKTIDPMKLVWSKVKNGEPVNLMDTYENLI